MQIEGILEISEICHFSSRVLAHVFEASSVSMRWGQSSVREKNERIRARSCFDCC